MDGVHYVTVRRDFFSATKNAKTNASQANNEHQQSTSSSSGGSPKFECSLCTKSFNSRSLLNRHLKNHIVVSNSSPQSSSSASNSPHGNDLKCEQGNCNGRIFASQISLVKHIKTMHAEQDCDKKLSEKRFQCGQCHKRFPTSKDLKRHDVVHTGNREFQCSFCSHRFGRKDHRMRHEKKTHANELLANELSPISLKDQEQKRPIQRWRHVSSPSITPTQDIEMSDLPPIRIRAMSTSSGGSTMSSTKAGSTVTDAPLFDEISSLKYLESPLSPESLLMEDSEDDCSWIKKEPDNPAPLYENKYDLLTRTKNPVLPSVYIDNSLIVPEPSKQKYPGNNLLINDPIDLDYFQSFLDDDKETLFPV